MARQLSEKEIRCDERRKVEKELEEQTKRNIQENCDHQFGYKEWGDHSHYWRTCKKCGLEILFSDRD